MSDADVMSEFEREQRIRRSWLINQAAWTGAVRNGEIESRERVTNQAIVVQLESLKAGIAGRRMLDIGCGEGWLARLMAERGWQVTAVDAGPELIRAAKQVKHQGLPIDYHCLDYQQLLDHKLVSAQAVLVFNFSLLGNESVSDVLRGLARRAESGAVLLIQTLHPYSACGEAPYSDGWREGSWDGFSERFIEAPPWYFRTIASWCGLLQDSGWTLQTMHEPILEGRPASLLLQAVKS